VIFPDVPDPALVQALAQRCAALPSTSHVDLSLDKHSPDPRTVEPPKLGEVIEHPTRVFSAAYRAANKRFTDELESGTTVAAGEGARR
jgi:hypothetical protein